MDITVKWLEWFPCNATAAQMVSWVTDCANSGKTEREFWKFLDANAIVHEREASGLLLQAITMTIYGESRRAQCSDEVTRELLPYWQYWTVGNDSACCKKHEKLDGLVLKADHPAWADIYPPNSWGCACSVVPLSREEWRAATRIRVTEAMRTRCRNWLETDPRKLLNLL